MVLAPLLKVLFRAKSSLGTNRKVQRQAVLTLEPLEDRLVPSSLTRVAPSFESRLQSRLVGDFTGDGKADVAVFGHGHWNVLVSDSDHLHPQHNWGNWRGTSFVRLV